MDATSPVPRPSALLALTEMPRALVEWGALGWHRPLLADAPRGDGHAVLVLPGFLKDDGATATLRGFLRDRGYDAHGWELGRNTGPRAIGREGERLAARLRAIHDRTGRRVSLVGWSLGGVMARLAAARAPDAVRRVVTLGSPFAGSPRSTNLCRLYELVSGHRIDDRHALGLLAEAAAPSPAPSTAIYSRGDGVVAWACCREPDAPGRDNIEVRGSHLGLVANASVLWAVADRLALAEGEWRPFRPTGRAARLFPAIA